ncbi:MAG: cytochrome c family protein [Bacteroidales bacterium]
MFRKKTVLIAFLALLAGGALQAQNFKYIGADKCKMCHNKPNKGEQYNVWLKGPHANAMKTLASAESKAIAQKKGIADPTTDQACVKCHATTGHAAASEIATLTVSDGVSCESCHGPGSMYKGASIMRNQQMALTKGLILPTAEVCKKCHNEESPTYKPFNYDEKVAMIAHPDPTLQ